QLLLREAALTGLARERRAARRETEPVLPANLLAEATALEVRARLRPGLRLPEVALVERGCRVEHGVEPLAAPALRVLLGRGLLVLERNVEPLRQPLDRADEVDPLRLLDEGDCVASPLAAEAVVRALLGADGKGRRPLVVERAEPRESGARTAKRSAAGEDLDDVGDPLDGFDRGVGDPRHLVLEPRRVRERETIGHAGDVIGGLLRRPAL